MNPIQEVLRDLEASYTVIAEDFEEELMWQLEQGLSIELAVQEALRVTAFKSDVEDLEESVILILLCLGYGLHMRDLPEDVAKRLQNKMLTTSWTQDKQPPIARLRSLPIEQMLVQVISSTLRKGESVAQMAQDLDKHLLSEDLPERLDVLIDKARRAVDGNGGLVKDLKKHARNLLRQTRKKEEGEVSKYYALLLTSVYALLDTVKKVAVNRAVSARVKFMVDRVIKTEAARAYFEGFMAKTLADDTVWAVKYTLSPKHKIFDICDVLANMDVGYGKGVYPKELAPYLPRHPFCMCTYRAVRTNRPKDALGIDENGGMRYIDSLSDAERRKLFGVEGAKAYNDGEDWQSLLRGWDGFSPSKIRVTSDDFRG